MRTDADAHERYALFLAEADQRLSTAASPAEIAIIVKFPIAENAGEQQQASSTAATPRRRKSKKLRVTLAEAQAIGCAML